MLNEPATVLTDDLCLVLPLSESLLFSAFKSDCPQASSYQVPMPSVKTSLAFRPMPGVPIPLELFCGIG